ncbi:MAG TPA: hypothetical protein VGP44_08060, partial [Gemmatimonadales bacterium]|nr:hypothetical protein [Gemmatimonadales bacterium]
GEPGGPELRIDGDNTDAPGPVLRRFVAIHFVYHLSGAGLDLAKARRAVALSLDKYCSVIHSLASDIRITHELALD